MAAILVGRHFRRNAAAVKPRAGHPVPPVSGTPLSAD
jgi:hypothetical protein